ncbi:hypothetical protein A4R26_15170 [Niastella populi]|uniref:Carbohydrate-binding protein SusD n=1 Tax=Niastella populi TaxID=550983 RepID=A0A1V9G391_9BACT|nr:hypothetical protein A4R26_15170 [Niastella populi]
MWLKYKVCFCTAVICSMLTAAGCRKLVQVGEPDDSMTSPEVFSSDSLAQAAISGLYIKIMSNSKFLLNGGMSLFPSLSSDELVRNMVFSFEDQFTGNILNSNNTLINSNLWKAAYAYIYQCNICIQGLERSNSITSGLKTRLSGEVKFVRALCYYYLVNLFGDVPLVLGTNADVNMLMSRTPEDQVYNQVVLDLNAAGDALTGVNDKRFPTSFAAKALLARVNLHLSNWSRADELTSDIINSGQFHMEDNLSEVFKSQSREVIFQWAPVQNRQNSAEGFMFIPLGSGRPNYSVSDHLWKAFETGDLRKGSWIRSVMANGQTYNFPFKYKLNLSPVGTPPEEYNVVFRLAEQYLIRAEARAKQNRVEEAISDINIIRTRAGLPELATTISKEQCLQAIEQERRTELFTEWGHRWIDLKRTNRADEVLSAIKGSSWQANDKLYPIPFAELETAPNLKQNPGYE